MRNKIHLYIEGVRADLDEGSFLLMNYTAEDLANPVVVRNSFSKQITLKGTPANDEIFGHIYRNDRNTVYGSPYIGPNFDPCRKTSFVLYNDANEIIESGYLKLDSIEQTRRKRSYKVTLYGGLGSFLYGISYKANGDKMTLADLDFGETLDFTIERDTVAAAWQSLDDEDQSGKWTIINFMPSYDGIPPSPFDANKCFVVTWAAGLKGQNDDGTYKAIQTIVTLNDKVTGISARDYRSYLQKPVIRLKSIIQAICDPSNNGGWTVNIDPEFTDSDNPHWPYWNDTWMTLPSLYDLNINETETTTTQTMTSLGTVLPISGGGGTGVYKVTVNANVYANMMGLPALNYKLWCRNANGITMNLFEIKLTLYDSSQNELTVARYYITTDGTTFANLPTPDFTFDHIDSQGYFVDANGNQVTFPIYAEAIGAAYYKVQFDCHNYYNGAINANPGDMAWYMWNTGESTFTNTYRFDPGALTTNVEIIGLSSSTVRTGASITKAILLGGGQTPADYLLSFCKMFGFQMLVHKDEKVVDLLLRKNFYSSTVTDINGKIDRAKGMTKKPFAFDARWYLFGNDAEGVFADYYASRYSRPFGQFRVNTGYEFDASEKNLTKSIVFGNLCSLMEASPFFCNLVKDGKNIPPVFLSGGEYLLFRGSETMSVSLPYLADAAKTWDNSSYPMHDAWDKPQIHGDGDSHIDERDTLVFFNGMKDTSAMHLSLTDDTEMMLYLNGNNPCWMPNYCDVDATWKINKLPHFSRYKWTGPTINTALDFGNPLEIQIPGSVITPTAPIFPQYWERYITDRYDDDSAVVTCYVDLRGMQVNENLFRRFYAFDGAIWTLNRIIDHSLTTNGPTKCEFVKVQDKTNYTTL